MLFISFIKQVIIRTVLLNLHYLVTKAMRKSDACFCYWK